MVKVTMTEWPSESDWAGTYARALITENKKRAIVPPVRWRERILRARHSPIRYLRFSFLIEDLPSYVSVHLVRHIHAQPYVGTQRNDRQKSFDRRKAPQDTPVSMIWDMNAEELMVIMNKRLCGKASEETRTVVEQMKEKVLDKCPEFKEFLVPMCQYTGGCKEMKPCTAGKDYENE